MTGIFPPINQKPTGRNNDSDYTAAASLVAACSHSGIVSSRLKVAWEGINSVHGRN